MNTPTQEIFGGIIVVCWALFLLFWLIMAFSTKRTLWNQTAGERLWQTFFMVIGAVLIVNRGNLGIPDDTLWPFVLPVGIIAVICAVAGLITLIWSRVTLGRNWSGRVVLKEDHELVTSGPYSLVRHPIYSGLLLLALGEVINYGRLLPIIGILILFIGLSIRIRQEEALMNRQFPDKYPEYMKRTKRLVPWVW